MRAHMNTTARAGAEARTKRTILALGLAVALFAATASTASTTPTPPAPPLTLSVNGAHVGQRHENLKFGRGDKKTLYFGVITSNDSTLVATGDVEKTTTQVAAALEQCPEGFDGGPPRVPANAALKGRTQAALAVPGGSRPSSSTGSGSSGSRGSRPRSRSRRPMSSARRPATRSSSCSAGARRQYGWAEGNQSVRPSTPQEHQKVASFIDFNQPERAVRARWPE
jgi:hypothetical protein